MTVAITLDAAVQRRRGLGVIATVTVIVLFLAANRFLEWFVEVVEYESTWQWWLSAYLIIGLLVAALSAFVGFFVIWWMAAKKWGGVAFVFGWLPASILAVLGGFLLIFLWAPVAGYLIERYEYG